MEAKKGEVLIGALGEGVPAVVGAEGEGGEAGEEGQGAGQEATELLKDVLADAVEAGEVLETEHGEVGLDHGAEDGAEDGHVDLLLLLGRGAPLELVRVGCGLGGGCTVGWF